MFWPRYARPNELVEVVTAVRIVLRHVVLVGPKFRRFKKVNTLKYLVLFALLRAVLWYIARRVDFLVVVAMCFALGLAVALLLFSRLAVSVVRTQLKEP